MSTCLVTGFEPFLGLEINPTEMVCKEIDGIYVGDMYVHTKVLPVDFQKGPEALLEAVDELQPDVILALGLAAGRTAITPERIAINVCDGEPDNEGVIKRDDPIVLGGPAAYFSTLPNRAFVEALHAKSYPANISNTAGTYLCNAVMYTALHEANRKARPVQAGFVHIPASHELVIQSGKKMSSWSQQDLTAAVRCLLEVIGEEHQSDKLS
ncbi:pyroglutamyl-peptidase I [Bacillus fonticola]|uniref:pyroglutamyl-peptidase I n=1 Tax=Bacillus fonticola TaxID=2728853 RepID=UPI001474FC35|nr:pyroglutamyl-peptidase I [Bacillus fonticola]